jgi:hypothetical protein
VILIETKSARPIPTLHNYTSKYTTTDCTSNGILKHAINLRREWPMLMYAWQKTLRVCIDACEELEPRIDELVVSIIGLIWVYSIMSITFAIK